MQPAPAAEPGRSSHAAGGAAQCAVHGQIPPAKFAAAGCDNGKKAVVLRARGSRESPGENRLAAVGARSIPSDACAYRRAPPAMFGRPGLLCPFVSEARDDPLFAAVGSITPTFGLDPNTLL